MHDTQKLTDGLTADLINDDFLAQLGLTVINLAQENVPKPATKNVHQIGNHMHQA